jgi:hypothetical protein
MELFRSIALNSRRTRLSIFCIGAGWIMLSATSLPAEDWMFRRSYYSHHMPAEHLEQCPPPRRRTAYRPAYAGVTPGFAIRGADRYNRIQLGQGRNADVTIYRQNWFELEP